MRYPSTDIKLMSNTEYLIEVHRISQSDSELIVYIFVMQTNEQKEIFIIVSSSLRLLKI